MILSLNPGGSEPHYKRESSKQFEKDDFSLPKQNEYSIRDYPFAKKIREFFKGNEELLETSVAFTILFFRSQDFNFWEKNTPITKRIEMENFSYDKVKLIIQTLNPKTILVIGSKTYKRLGKILDLKNENR